jgi:integrase
MNKMASVRLRGEYYHIQWYDPFEEKIRSKSTGLTAGRANKLRAERYADKLQQELTMQSQKLKEIGIERISISDAYEHFLRNNQVKDPKTIKDYHRFYGKFTETFYPSASCSSITKIKVEDWLNEIKKLPFAKNTIHGYGKQCTHFLNFLFEYNYTPMFRINRDVKTKPEVKEKIIFNEQDIVTIFNGLIKKSQNFITVIYMLFYTGLRPSDIMNIKLEGINIKQRTLKYYSPKRKKYREIPFHKDLIKIMRTLIAANKSEMLLTYRATEAISYQVSRYFNKIGLNNKGYSARTFRKTFITFCRSKYKIDASVVRELVGHEHGNTTDKYYNDIDVETMKEALDKFKRPKERKKKRA